MKETGERQKTIRDAGPVSLRVAMIIYVRLYATMIDLKARYPGALDFDSYDRFRKLKTGFNRIQQAEGTHGLRKTPVSKLMQIADTHPSPPRVQNHEFLLELVIRNQEFMRWLQHRILHIASLSAVQILRNSHFPDTKGQEPAAFDETWACRVPACNNRAVSIQC